jgi:hypothetical protein
MQTLYSSGASTPAGTTKLTVLLLRVAGVASVAAEPVFSYVVLQAVVEKFTAGTVLPRSAKAAAVVVSVLPPPFGPVTPLRVTSGAPAT